jgi:branched-subunit amino acid transport protein
MSATEVWMTIGLMTLATIIARSSFFLFGGSVRLPPRLQHALRYAPAAALAAIVVPDLLMTGGTVNVSVANPKLLAGLGATMFFLATRRLLTTLIVGMTLFTIFRLML